MIGNTAGRPDCTVMRYMSERMPEGVAELILDVARHLLYGPAITVFEFRYILIEVLAEPMRAVRYAKCGDSSILCPNRQIRVTSFHPFVHLLLFSGSRDLSLPAWPTITNDPYRGAGIFRNTQMSYEAGMQASELARTTSWLRAVAGASAP